MYLQVCVPATVPFYYPTLPPSSSSSGDEDFVYKAAPHLLLVFLPNNVPTWFLSVRNVVFLCILIAGRNCYIWKSFEQNGHPKQ
jgi:hypothetical protein